MNATVEFSEIDERSLNFQEENDLHCPSFEVGLIGSESSCGQHFGKPLPKNRLLESAWFFPFTGWKLKNDVRAFGDRHNVEPSAI